MITVIDRSLPPPPSLYIFCLTILPLIVLMMILSWKQQSLTCGLHLVYLNPIAFFQDPTQVINAVHYYYYYQYQIS